MGYQTVMKVNVRCAKCRRKLLKAVSIIGVNQIIIDPAKDTLTVIGDAEPFEIIARTKKTCNFIELVTVGPHPPPPKATEKPKSDEEKSTTHKPPTCSVCQSMSIIYMDHYPSCTIL